MIPPTGGGWGRAGGWPCLPQPVRSHRTPFLSAFGLIKVLDQGVGSCGLSRTGLTVNKEASLGGLEGGDDVVCDLSRNRLRLD